jgi:hypothetical protein
LFRATTALKDDETNTLTIREDKKDKYFGLKSDPPYYLRILNAEMSDRGNLVEL